MLKRFRGRRPLRETLAANNAADRFYAGAAGVEPRFQTVIKPKRTQAPRNPDAIYEKDVLAAVLLALRNDPRVAFCDRRQSGVFQDGNRYIRVGTPGTLDTSGMLIGGRYFEIECKRPGEKPDERQRNRIDAIKANGGISGYATSAEEAIALLP